MAGAKRLQPAVDALDNQQKRYTKQHAEAANTHGGKLIELGGTVSATGGSTWMARSVRK
jgi:uncharacterized protein (DUF1330 family)